MEFETPIMRDLTKLVPILVQIIVIIAIGIIGALGLFVGIHLVNSNLSSQCFDVYYQMNSTQNWELEMPWFC